MQDNLAFRMRPKTIDQVNGQEHLVGKENHLSHGGKPNCLSSMVSYGPPGIGRTSIAWPSLELRHALRSFQCDTDR